jgi:hypothetical protein
MTQYVPTVLRYSTVKVKEDKGREKSASTCQTHTRSRDLEATRATLEPSDVQSFCSPEVTIFGIRCAPSLKTRRNKGRDDDSRSRISRELPDQRWPGAVLLPCQFTLGVPLASPSPIHPRRWRQNVSPKFFPFVEVKNFATCRSKFGLTAAPP